VSNPTDIMQSPAQEGSTLVQKYHTRMEVADRDKPFSSGRGKFKPLFDFNFSLSLSIFLSFTPFDEKLHPSLIFEC
jgi:hypothetical protein